VLFLKYCKRNKKRGTRGANESEEPICQTKFNLGIGNNDFQSESDKKEEIYLELGTSHMK
jgi:hypothetical protein